MGYFLQLGGMEGGKVFDITVAIAGIMAVGCICSWPLIEKLGRRGTFLVGEFSSMHHAMGSDANDCRNVYTFGLSPPHRYPHAIHQPLAVRSSGPG